MLDAKKIILPYELNVELIAYQTHAFPLGIIKANIQNYDCWLCNKYINFYLPAPDGFFSIYEEDLWPCREGIMTGFERNFALETSRVDFSKIIDENKDLLGNGYYIYGVFNDFYIPQKSAYHKRDFRHIYIIFGYDDNTQVFKSAGYLENGHYDFFDIKYEDYYNSLIGTEISKLWTRYYKVNHNYTPQIDITNLKSKFQKYLNSEKESCSEDDPGVYGMEALDKFLQYIKSNEGDFLDYRYGRIYMEHKYIMYKRLMFLYQNSYIKDNLICDEYYQKVYLQSKIVFNLFIKYNITAKHNTFKRICDIVSNINETERNLIETLNATLTQTP